ncbi:GNAT family N-acetyltransferase [Actinacidiphila sp. ITFR-21]|uniref:GNAT family N-acetyltransferase n=1 Tax=Actinacidiphila sp. ITFR-21 TaxID=3075199 RepID=UPI002889B370|nr:GNAT family N-acetyltransferase [Streptomyces sp. ITFR-21]WNI15408.1 GNAT family N-acetyltransferase [Streptomyces sp. ITFR-21]
MRIDEVAWADPDAVALRDRQRAEIAVRYGTPDSEPGVPPSAADIAVFFVARDTDGTGVGCGGLRALGEGVGEVKRMYVDPAHRGSGVAPLILRTLEDWARGRGWTALRLETGDAQPDAVRFYTRSGYRRIPNFGVYADAARSLCFERSLPERPGGAAGSAGAPAAEPAGGPAADPPDTPR